MLHSIHCFNQLDRGLLSESERALQNVFEMANIIRFCGTKTLRRLKHSKLSLLVDRNMDLMKFDEVKVSQLEDIHLLLAEMKDKLDAIPIEEIITLSDTVTQSVRWLKAELKRNR